MIFFTFSRYVSSLFLRWFLLLSAIFITFILLFDFTELQRRASSRTTPIPFVEKVEMVLLKVPFLLEQLLPFLVFGGALGLFWRLNRYCELAIFRTSGLSVWQISFPPFCVALLIGFFDLSFVQPLSTAFLQQYQYKNATYFDQRSPQIFSISPSGLWVKKNEPNVSIIYQIQNLKAESQILEKVSIYIFSLQQEFLVRYDATQASLLPDGIILQDVWILTPDLPARYEKACTLPFHLTLEHIYNSSPDPQLVSFWNLSDLITLLDQAGVSSRKYALQKASLWARALWLSAMILLAAAFSFRPIRKGKILPFLILGGLSCFFLYIIKDITYALGVAGNLPIFLAAWTPVILSFLIAGTLIFHFEEGRM